MAEKLKKSTAKKPATKKTATKAGGKKADAGSAPKSQFDDKAKITLTEKGEAKLKKGAETGATENLRIMKKAKTVGKALAEGLKGGDISYAAKSGTVTVG